jgi:uncharacterized membrane protein
VLFLVPLPLLLLLPPPPPPLLLCHVATAGPRSLRSGWSAQLRRSLRVAVHATQRRPAAPRLPFPATPRRGAWGLWYLPGSAEFHVEWTGVAEILGGLGLMIGSLPFDAVPAWLAPASAYGLCLLTAVVTPANVYMFTHNAPGPLPKDKFLPWQGHVARGFMQAVLIATLWGIATASQ